MADAAAREELCSSSPRPFAHLFYEAAKILLKETITSATKSWWSENAPEFYKRLGIDSYTRTPKKLTLTRLLLSRLCAARSGHGDFAAYHHRLNHRKAHIHCSCSEPKSSTRFLECTIPP
ncbi:BgTH12-05840 [Blumeria graminis f. sp. triticale]|uniref:BgTH12-05840 n=1 Tax=Blumeria graminis f. sp. triticale TaxID=1689686 RepID=A0A9W4D4N9_BLUGR|nr:BgTH12-05840 [Blumeria graminis f. sp. triticale]